MNYEREYNRAFYTAKTFARTGLIQPDLVDSMFLNPIELTEVEVISFLIDQIKKQLQWLNAVVSENIANALIYSSDIERCECALEWLENLI